MTLQGARADSGQVLGEELIFGVNDKLPMWQYVVYGFQMLIADGMTALVLPVLLGTALKLEPSETAKILAASLFGAGLVSIGQSLLMLRMPVLQGPGISFVAIVPIGAVSYGIDSMFTAMWISALLVAALSWPLNVLPKMRRFISQPAIYGTFLVLVSATIGNAIFGQIVGHPGSKFYASGYNYLIAFTPFVVALLFTVLIPGSRWRPVVLLAGGCTSLLLAAGFGQTNFHATASANWFSVPDFQPFGFNFNFGAVLLVFGGYFINLFEGIGTYKVFIEDIAGQEMTDKRVGGGLLTEGVGSAVAGLFGGLGTTTYTQNIGSIAVTRVGTRFQVTAAGVILLLVAFCGKLQVAVATLPGPVLGGLLFTTVSLMLMQGIKSLGEAPFNGANLYAIGGGVLAGTGLMSVSPDIYKSVPSMLRPFVSSPLIVGLAMATLIMILFSRVPSLRSTKTPGKGPRTQPAVGGVEEET